MYRYFFKQYAILFIYLFIVFFICHIFYYLIVLVFVLFYSISTIILLLCFIDLIVRYLSATNFRQHCCLQCIDYVCVVLFCLSASHQQKQDNRSSTNTLTMQPQTYDQPNNPNSTLDRKSNAKPQPKLPASTPNIVNTQSASADIYGSTNPLISETPNETLSKSNENLSKPKRSSKKVSKKQKKHDRGAYEDAWDIKPSLSKKLSSESRPEQTHEHLELSSEIPPSRSKAKKSVDKTTPEANGNADYDKIRDSNLPHGDNVGKGGHPQNYFKSGGYEDVQIEDDRTPDNDQHLHTGDIGTFDPGYTTAGEVSRQYENGEWKSQDYARDSGGYERPDINSPNPDDSFGSSASPKIHLPGSGNEESQNSPKVPLAWASRPNSQMNVDTAVTHFGNKPPQSPPSEYSLESASQSSLDTPHYLGPKGDPYTTVNKIRGKV